MVLKPSCQDALTLSQGGRVHSASAQVGRAWGSCGCASCRDGTPGSSYLFGAIHRGAPGSRSRVILHTGSLVIIKPHEAEFPNYPKLLGSKCFITFCLHGLYIKNQYVFGPNNKTSVNPFWHKTETEALKHQVLLLK